jgi:hypothetical protein
MRIRFTAFCFCLAWAGMFALYGEESAPGQSKPTETKAGMLSEKPGNAGEGVVAVLTARAAPRVRGKNETPKEGGTEAKASSEEKINLIAEGALATQLTDLAKRNSTVEVTGILDGASMKVTQVIETAEGTTAPKRKKK